MELIDSKSVGVELTKAQVERIVAALAHDGERDERLDKKLASALVRLSTLRARIMSANGRRGEHVCHAIGCASPTPPSKLMCPFHWAQVPTDIQDRVYAEFRPDQCSGDKRPSMAWLKAARDAINAVDKVAEKFRTIPSVQPKERK